MNASPTFWFPVKRYGWGWGLPVTWQGWLVFVAYYALVLLGCFYFIQRYNVFAMVCYIAGVTVLLVAIVAWKGERPLAWRWGKR